MPLLKEDLLQIEELFEELITKKEDSSPSLSDREIFERRLNVELELKHQRDLIEKLLHQMDKRFGQMDKRFEEQREDINRRFEEQREDINRRFEEQREDINRRFEEQRKNTDKRFTQLFWFIGLFIPLSNSLLFLAINYALK